jgi:hypothetical protein
MPLRRASSSWLICSSPRNPRSAAARSRWSGEGGGWLGTSGTLSGPAWTIHPAFLAVCRVFRADRHISASSGVVDLRRERVQSTAASV